MWFRKRLKLPPSAWVPEKPKIEDAIAEEVFGAVDFTGKASMDWRKWRPKHEIQSWGDCVTFSYLNVIETLARANNLKDDEGRELNFSDLYLAVKSGTSQRGNSLNKICETARKQGVVLEKHCKYTRNWGERDSIVATVLAEVKRYLIGTGHAWVKTNINSLKSSLDRGPLQIGVGLGDTYSSGASVIEPPSSIRVYHAMMMDHIDDVNKYYCYDHYNRQEVKLSSRYNIMMAKEIVPDGLPDGWQAENAADLAFWKRMLDKFIIRPESHGEVYRVWSHELQKVIFDISDGRLFNLVQGCLKEKKAFIGVSEKDFERLLTIMKDYKSQMKEAGDLINLSKLLTK